MSLGSVSTALADKLRDDARKYGLLVWLDKDEIYREFVDQLASPTSGFPFPVIPYRGSFLEIVLALDGHEDGVTIQPLVLHMPGFNEEEITRTPLFEMYRAGRRWRLALPRLVRDAAEGRVAPFEIDAAEKSLANLDDADRWLDGLIRGQSRHEDVALPVGSPTQLFDDLVGDGPVATHLGEPAWQHAVTVFLERSLGIDAAWRSRFGGIDSKNPTEQAFVLASWALCVEFVHDLRRSPKDPFLEPLTRLSKGLVDSARALAQHLRIRHPEIYDRDAGQVEAGLTAEVREATAADLGAIDTFRFEDQKVFAAALSALEGDRWEEASTLAADRTEERSFWVRRDAARRTGWQLVTLSAEVGLACARHAEMLRGARTLIEASDRYVGGGFEADQAHRRLEQARARLALVQLDEFPTVLRCLNHVRGVYRQWADTQSLAFNSLCKEVGFLPDASRQQRTLFDDVVKPLAGAGGTVAYFLVDALRFEMAKELLGGMPSEGGAKVSLDARFAELPTLTEVGMNVLAPLARNGRLEVDVDGSTILGFRSGETRVAAPDQRKKAIHERVGGETCPWLALEDLLDRDVSTIRKTIGRARLLVVHAEGIDKAGEKGVGLSHFDTELQRLRSAWIRLRDAGVRRFVLTADHGFLLLDDTTRRPVKHGRQTDPKRRHVIERVAADHAGEVRVSATELRYDGSDVQFMFPASTMPFDVGDRAKDFVHGGNSLQERIIPVLTALYRHAKGESATRYRVETKPLKPVMGLHRIEVMVRLDERADLPFAESREVELRLEALDADGVMIELIDAPGARIMGGAVVGPVDARFEVLFKLSGPEALRAQVRLVGALGGDDVISTPLERRFAVQDRTTADARAESTAGESKGAGAVTGLPEGGVRRVFEHIAKFGSINETDATQMLGSAREFRRFSANFERYADVLPFGVRIDVSSGQKRYVREGN